MAMLFLLQVTVGSRDRSQRKGAKNGALPSEQEEQHIRRKTTVKKPTRTKKLALFLCQLLKIPGPKWQEALRSCGCCSFDHGGVMAELPSKVHLTSHPICLRIRGPSVYEDENQRTWLHLFMDTEGVLQVRLRQEDIPSGHIARTTGLVTSSTMPWMWTLHPGSKYMDGLYQFWRIVHHVKENGVEEMILELMEDS
ncbi:Protein p13 MTCP-1 [Myotis brandtii]|uniref:Protein p13 MTCP-1 n=1 Tax=Myotis brandtii TaxID=109478 RepID=S7MQB5_MYOBR|nr:Protein p13 MTCP-1 [Myotis brandtii]